MERKTGSITIAGTEYFVKELTASQVERVMATIENGEYEGHFLDVLMGRPFPACALFEAIGVEPDEFSLDLSPSEIAAIYDKVIEVNPTCAAMLERVYAAGAKLQQSGVPQAN